MERIDSAEALRALLSGQLRPGVRTNLSGMKMPWQDEEIAAGRLLAQSFEGGLLLFHRKARSCTLHYYLQKDAALPEIVSDLPVLTELPYREGDSQEDALEQRFLDRGFVLRFRRLRRCRPEHAPLPAPKQAYPVRYAEMADLDRVLATLQRFYDPLTACLPTERELAADIARGDVMVPVGLDGVLRYCPSTRGVEFRHFAVEAAARGTGAAQSLFNAYSAEHPARAYAWMRADNGPINGFLEKNHFQIDKWRSAVFCLEPQSKENEP